MVVIQWEMNVKQANLFGAINAGLDLDGRTVNLIYRAAVYITVRRFNETTIKRILA